MAKAGSSWSDFHLGRHLSAPIANLNTSAAASAGFTTSLMDPHREHAWFAAFSPQSKLAFGYVWNRTDFPWLGIWEENHSRRAAPWNGATLTCGMEFGVSPMPESRRAMIYRGRLFDVATYRWIPARSRIEVEYWAVLRDADAVPEWLEFRDVAGPHRRP